MGADVAVRNRVPAWRPSQFNFSISEGSAPNGSAALYNSATGALTKLDGPDVVALVALLESPHNELPEDGFAGALFDTLSSGGFIVPADKDEILEIRKRYWQARGGTPAVITITTTMDCNLGCYYCYEERSQDALQTDSIDLILALIDRTVIGLGRKSLHVDWYGGEPLLNFDFLNEASGRIQDHCRANGVAYNASIISNGTMWPKYPATFVAQHAIRQVQISFDGMRANHDKSRRTRKGFHYSGNKIILSSFDEAVLLVDALVDAVRVDVRFNIDRRNLADLIPFLDFAEARGWFAAKFPAVFQPARLAAYSSSSSFMRKVELTLAEFDEARSSVRARMQDIAKVEESEAPDGYPFPKTSVCAALSQASSVVGADRALYRCGLQVGEAGRAVGNLSDSKSADFQSDDGQWWSSFDPTTLSTCEKCSFLPVCWGGCPKKHLERDAHAIAEQGRYWRTNLPRLIAKAAKMHENFSPQSFTEQQQFRGVDSLRSDP